HDGRRRHPGRAAREPAHPARRPAEGHGRSARWRSRDEGARRHDGVTGHIYDTFARVRHSPRIAGDNQTRIVTTPSTPATGRSKNAIGLPFALIIDVTKFCSSML